LFGLASPLTDIPDILPTTPTTDAAAHPEALLAKFRPPKVFSFGLAPEVASPDAPESVVNDGYYTESQTREPQTEEHYLSSNAPKRKLMAVLNETNVDVIRAQQHYDTSACTGIPTFSDKPAPAPSSASAPVLAPGLTPETWAALRTVPRVTTPSTPEQSFLRLYGAYGLPEERYTDVTLGVIVSFFEDCLPCTAVINPRVVGIRDEWHAAPEGCFSVPFWTADVDRPVAIDVEFETLQVRGAITPRHHSGAGPSALLSKPLHGPNAKKMHRGGFFKHKPGNKTPEQLRADAEALPYGTIAKYADYTSDRQLIAAMEAEEIPLPEDVSVVTLKVTMRDLSARYVEYTADMYQLECQFAYFFRISSDLSYFLILFFLPSFLPPERSCTRRTTSTASPTWTAPAARRCAGKAPTGTPSWTRPWRCCTPYTTTARSFE
jgi:hypothetical protein